MTTVSTRRAPTVAMVTHGCKLNQADSSVMASDLLKAGYRLVDQQAAADVYVVNTCTVTHIADRKARQALRAAKRRSPDSIVVATGCYAQRAAETLRNMSEVDLVVGNTAKSNLVELIRELSPPRPSVPLTKGDDSVPVDVIASRSRAMVKIQEGCNQVCAYCIVPRVRGRERTVPPSEIVRKVNAYVATGVKEVVLTGTQLGSYGYELEDIDLPGMIKRVLHETEVPRIRVSSLQPQEVDETLLSIWSDDRLCPHFHLALQSGSDLVLDRMRRRYTVCDYLDAVNRIRQTVPSVSVTTDVIVGFPGETDEQFGHTYALCDRVEFASMHVFPYSERPGTSAAHFGDQLDGGVKRARTNSMLGLSQRHADNFRKDMEGTVHPVLWERRDAIGNWIGLTDNYVKVMGRSPRNLGNEITLAQLRHAEGKIVIADPL